jgi:hypothetical protein
MNTSAEVQGLGLGSSPDHAIVKLDRRVLDGKRPFGRHGHLAIVAVAVCHAVTSSLRVPMR